MHRLTTSSAACWRAPDAKYAGIIRRPTRMATGLGQGRRAIAAQLPAPASTVARWTRRFAANAQALRGHLTRRIVALG
jgi:hypothetical protein